MSSQAFLPTSPASIMEEISTRTMSDVVKDFNTEELIEYLKKKNLKLEDYGLKAGLATTLAKFIEGLSQKLQNYSSLKTLDDLKEMLHRNKINGEDITNIKQFTPIFKKISDDDKAFEHCMEDIILKLSNVKTMTDANEKDISGEDSTGRVDYAIKALEDLLCITEGKPHNIKIRYAQNLAQLESAFQTNEKKRTADQAFGNDYFDYIYGIVTTGTEWHFIIYTPDGIYSTSGSEYQINLTKSTVKENPELLRTNLYEKACDVEDVSIKANQAEILCWSNFIIAFDKSIDEIMARDRVGMKKAKGLIYDFILAQNPDTKRPALYKKIERARKIYRLTERIGLDKIKHIKSYSANSISKFTNEEIQRIIDHFTKNPNMEFTDDSENVEQDNEVLEEPDQINVLEVLPPKESTAPIPLTHITDNSKWFDEDMFSMGNSGDEMPDESDNDDGYDGYGGYNEYGERDRGYYYRDGRYERKSSPMMSPIISPVTA
ncbi:hypothetical protein C1645_835049 [Glomus cerebriforme]|uniref:Uncharacterized protein n=1 Tax=Glomus cerebriforme TaxID=658196 RepID=A0A397SEG2_9GLOM|nr:hypothetical protein C1645_835049 [Glomus cerebriforme]